MAEQFYGTPTGPTQRGYDFVYNGSGPLRLAERLAARSQQRELANERIRLKASAQKAKKDGSNAAAFDKISGYDAGDYNSLLSDEYTGIINKHRGLNQQGKFDQAELRSDLGLFQPKATRLKNLTDQRTKLSTDLKSDYIDPATYSTNFNELVKKRYAAGQDVDADQIHNEVLQNADLIYGNKIADEIIKGTPRATRDVAYDRLGKDGLTTTTTGSYDVPTYAILNAKNNRIEGYDTNALLDAYTASKKGQQRLGLLLEKEKANPQSRYNTEQAKIEGLKASGKLRPGEYEKLSNDNVYGVVAHDFGDLDKRFGFDFKSGYNRENLSADQKEEFGTRGYTEGRGAIYTAGGRQDISVPELNFQMSSKQKITEPINTTLSYKQGAKGDLVEAGTDDNLNEGLASQNFSVTTVPTFRGIKGKQLYTPDGKPLIKNRIPTIQDIDKAAQAGNGDVYFKREDGKMVHMTKDQFLNSSYIEFPLYAKVDLHGKESILQGSSYPERYAEKSRSKGTYYLPLNQNKNPGFLNMAIDKGGFKDVNELKAKISNLARRGLLTQKSVGVEDNGEF